MSTMPLFVWRVAFENDGLSGWLIDRLVVAHNPEAAIKLFITAAIAADQRLRITSVTLEDKAAVILPEGMAW